MNLVVVARRPEIAERCAATIQVLTGRHPSRTIVIQSADPDGPSWLDARIEAHCVMPRARRRRRPAPRRSTSPAAARPAGTSPRSRRRCIIHDLPVTVWWPGEPPLRDRPAQDLLAGADRLVVDGSTWSGDGLDRLREMAGLARRPRRSPISDFALVRQSRWREAIASIFDDPDFLPYLRSLRRIAVTYATHDETGAPGSTNLVKPVYHVGWLASRLGLSVVKPLAPVGGGREAAASASRAAAGAAGGKPVDRPRARGDAVGRSRGGRRRRPAGRLDDAGRDDPARRAAGRAARLRAARRRDRRGRDRPRPRLAGRRRGARPALPGRRARRGRPARRSDRDRAARSRSRSGRCARAARADRTRQAR